MQKLLHFVLKITFLEIIIISFIIKMFNSFPKGTTTKIRFMSAEWITRFTFQRNVSPLTYCWSL